MNLKKEEMEERGISQVLSLMYSAARTAPKARGMDNLVITAFSGLEKEDLAEKMEEIASRGYQSRIFSRDAQNVRQAQAVLVIGTKLKVQGLDCGFCGFKGCAECCEAGARCAYDLIDLGIALGSAVSVAANHRVDNRIMYTVGYTAIKYKLLGEKVKVALGIPLSVSGKNIFFDRK
jgi:uncharacterized ferredoxin-like protein